MTATKTAVPQLLRADQSVFQYWQRCCPRSSGLDLLSYGTYHLSAGGVSDELYHRGREALLFTIRGSFSVDIGERTFALSHYDTLYVPRDTPYWIRNPSDDEGTLVVCQAPANTRHSACHSSWEKVSTDETRIRHLQGKDVFLMFDVADKADNLIAGYTIFDPNARSWPPHNHTDQEEVYIFCKGSGAIEVYESDENKTFVTSVAEMDAVTIPLLYYHPVFSQAEELHFIWCIAGERYWVGDKKKQFMAGQGDKLTT